MSEWNYDLESVPRGLPVMVLTTHANSRIATVAARTRVTPSTRRQPRIRCMLYLQSGFRQACAWRYLQEADFAALPPWRADSLRYFYERYQ